MRVLLGGWGGLLLLLLYFLRGGLLRGGLLLLLFLRGFGLRYLLLLRYLSWVSDTGPDDDKRLKT